MSRSITKHGTLVGALIILGTTLGVVLGLGIFAGTGTASSSAQYTAPPQNTAPPTIKGTPQEGQKLTGDRGTWSNDPTDYNLFWLRCDKNGGSCAKISGATSKTYRLTSVDVGNTLRFRVDAKNAAGTTSESSVPTAVIATATKPPPPAPATGCPSGTGTIQVADLKSPARLLIDGQQANPSTVHRGTGQLTLRYHVTACGGRRVQGALVYATAIPFQQLTIPPEQTTGSDGWARLDFRMLGGFPVSSKQQLIAVFVRARASGQDILGGISTRRLFSVPVGR